MAATTGAVKVTNAKGAAAVAKVKVRIRFRRTRRGRGGGRAGLSVYWRTREGRLDWRACVCVAPRPRVEHRTVLGRQGAHAGG